MLVQIPASLSHLLSVPFTVLIITIYGAAYLGYHRAIFAFLPFVLLYWIATWVVRYFCGELSVYRGTWLLTPIPREKVLRDNRATHSIG